MKIIFLMKKTIYNLIRNNLENHTDIKEYLTK